MLGAIALAVCLLGTFIYRSGPLLNNAILFKAPLPLGYIAQPGNYASDCKPLGPGEVSNPFDALAYCEDTAFWELHNNDVDGKQVSSRLVLAACDPNRKSWNTVMGPLSDPNPRGTLWVYNPGPNANAKPEKVELKGYPEGHDFHPLGFEIWPSYGGNASNLYVINHAREKTVIEQFVMDPSTPTVAKHIRTISSPYFVSPNSVALTSPDAFYVSNDHLITRRWPIIGPVVPLIETILGLPISFISHVTLNPASGSDAGPPIADHIFAAKFLPFPNGMSLSSDGLKLAVASSSLANVYFYARDPATNLLSPIKELTVPVPFCPDNVRFASSSSIPRQSNGEDASEVTEELIVAGHPHFPSLINLAKNVTGAASASWVVSIIPTRDTAESEVQRSHTSFDLQAPLSASKYVAAKGPWTLKTLFQSNGEEGGFASSSTAIRDPDTGALYVSGLYDERGVIECRAR